MELSNNYNSSFLWRIISFERIAKLSFILYLFFYFFGTSLPFRETKIDVDEYASNPFRQLVFSSLYFFSFISILPVLQKVFSIIKKEKFLFIFLLWTLLSVIWSDYSDISFKRWIQIFGGYIVCLSAVIYFDSQSILKYFRSLTYFYIILSFLAVVIIPGASMQYEGSRVWRGLAAHKNLFGELVLICTIIVLFSIRYLKTKNKTIDYLMLFISLLLLIGSRSTTSLIVLIILGLIAFSSKTQDKLGFGSLSKWIYYALLSAVLVFYSSALILVPSFLESIFGALGKDMTFTGRTDLWAYIIGIAFSASNPLIGVGYGGFWVYGSPNLIKLYSLTVERPIQAHNGYIDLTIETGFIGLSIVIIMTIWYFYNNFKKTDVQYWKYLVIATLIINLQEATLFKVNAITGFLFMLSYMLLFSRIAFQNEKYSDIT